MPLEKLRTLAEQVEARTFQPGDTVLKQGDEAAHFGVLLKGSLEAFARGDDGAKQALGRITQGETFNDLALMTGQPVTADFVAESACEVLLIPVSLFQSIAVTEPATVRALSRTIAERMKAVLADPLKAQALRQGDDPCGLQLEGQRSEKVLVINCGSSSLKYSFYDTADESRNARGQVERIGLDGTRLTHRGPGSEVTRQLSSGTYPAALQAMLSELTSASGFSAASERSAS